MNRKEYDKMRYQQNREQRLQYQREYYTTVDKEKLRLMQKKRYEETKRNGMWCW